MQPWFASLEGKYEIVRRLSGGGMGSVYLVRHRGLDELRVIKVMRTEIAEDASFRERFVREARTASQLRHSNIAQIHDFQTDEEGRAFLVLEFIDGVTFERLIAARPPVPLGLAVELACQTLAALGFLHRKEFVHRDIAPDNLMLTRDADGGALVKLIDLGIAKSLQTTETQGLTEKGAFLGKVRYAPPEQLEGRTGEHGLSARSDFYSLGIVLYQLLTGRFPIPGDTLSSLMRGHFFEPPLPFSTSDPEGRVPPELRAIVLQCLEKDPRNRPSDARELSKSLRALVPALPPEEGVEWSLARLLRGTAPKEATGPQGTTEEVLAREFGADDVSKGGTPATPPTVVMQPPAEVEGRAVDEAAPTTPAAGPPGWRAAAPPGAEPAAPRGGEPGAALQPTVALPSSAPASAPPAAATAPPPASAWLRPWLPVLAAVMLVALVALAWVLWRPAPAPPVERPGVAALPAGAVELVALPWARLESVRDEAGRPVAASGVTPLVLSLPPGRYRLVLRHEGSGERREVTVEVRPGERRREVFDLGVMDADRYLDGLQAP